MPKNKPLRLIETYAPDPARCAAALIRLLGWESPADTPEPPQDVACGEAPREEPAESDNAP